MNKNDFKPEKFYDNLAPQYNSMTRFANRMEREQENIKKMISKFHLQSAIDAACGNGIHSILLAQQGIKVTAIDISEKMITAAKSNADNYGVNIHFITSPMEKIDALGLKKADAVFCVGNSIPHILDPTVLLHIFSSFYNLLRPNGAVVLQLLNYDRILENQERIVNVQKKENLEFIRFYDFLDNKIRFNLLTIDWAQQPAENQLTSTMLYPYRKKELLTLLNSAGFKNINCYSDLKLAPFKNEKDLVIIAALQ